MKSLGVDVDYPLDQTCCGQPTANAGFEDESMKLALRFDDLLFQRLTFGFLDEEDKLKEDKLEEEERDER